MHPPILRSLLHPIQLTSTIGILLSASAAMAATTWTVCPAGCDSNSVQSVIQSASAGDTVELVSTAPHLESDIIVTKSLLFRGLPSLGATLRAAAKRGTADARVLAIVPGVSVELRDLRIEFGNDDDGGGILNQGILLLNRVELAENDASDSGGGLGNEAGAVAVLRDSDVIDNAALFGGGVANRGYLLVETSIFENNESVHDGGGIFSEVGTVLVDRSSFYGNVTSLWGGALSVTGGSLLLQDSQLRHNAATFGGGVSVRASASPVTVLRCTVRSNQGDTGGGFFVQAETAPELVNSTVILNQATSNGGGIYLFGERDIVLNSVTIAGNKANTDGAMGGTGGGIYVGTECTGTFCSATTVSMSNTLVGDNRRLPDGGGVLVPQDCFGDLVSNGHNLIATGSTSPLVDCEVVGDLIGTILGVDPMLGDAAAHGGVVLPGGIVAHTQPLLPASPAIDAGDPDGCRDSEGALLTTDQRYAARIGTCDIGAFEFDGVPVVPEPLFGDGFESGDTSRWSP